MHARIPALKFIRRNYASSLVLGIETSCDDTSVAIIDGGKRSVVQHLKVSQTAIHQQTDGIVPIAAGKAHRKVLPGLIARLFTESQVSIDQIGLIGVTRGPGLAASLTVGLQAAQQLSQLYNIPLLGVHHMAGHALVSRMESDIQFPFISLLVSGGHTLFMRVNGCTEFEIIGTTVDDSIGEALDKACRYLQIPWDSEKGPAASLEMHARLGKCDGIEFSLPFSGRDSKHNFNFSYSGMKTALQVKIASLLRGTGQQELTHEQKCCFAAAFQTACIEHLMRRLSRYYKQNSDAVTIPLVVGGGVASNQYLRERLRKLALKYGLSVVFPSVALCTDNAVMIAWTAHEWYNTTNSPFFQKAHDPHALRFIPKWPVNQIHLHSNL